MSMMKEDQPSAQTLSAKVHNAIDGLVNPPSKSDNVSVQPKYKEDPTRLMRCCEWRGKEHMEMVTRPAPDITEPGDAIIRVTTTLICGSDLHMYHNQVPGLKPMQGGDIMGHEFMGIVDKLGPDVQGFKVGDRVVVSCPIACGHCEFCRKEQYSLCDTTNPSGQQEAVYGHRLAGIFGYSHLTGGFAGGQAEIARVPYATMNMLKVPDALSDDQVVVLSDILPTGYHGTVLAEVDSNKSVAIWGCGPVGLMGILCCSRIHRAKVIVAIDSIPERLELARRFGATHTIDFNKQKDVVQAIADIVPLGPDCAIDYVGFRYTKTWTHTIQRNLHIESDSCEVAAEAIKAVKKGGNLALIGDYFMDTNGFPIGAMMEKAITVRGGQVYCQKYWRHLLQYIQDGTVDPRPVFSHRLVLDDAPAAYDIFAHKKDRCTKVMLKTPLGLKLDQQHGRGYVIGHTLNTEAAHNDKNRNQPVA